MCSFVNSVTDRLTGTLSLGAAILAAVMVSSLMVSELHVVGRGVQRVAQPSHKEDDFELAMYLGFVCVFVCVCAHALPCPCCCMFG